MRRAALWSALVVLPVPLWLGTDAAVRALVLPRLEDRLGAKVTIDRLRPAWPPGLSLQGVRTAGSSPLESASEIVVGLGGIVLRGGVIRVVPPAASAQPGPKTAGGAPRSLPRIRAENCTVHAVWAGGWVRAAGVYARPTASGWRVTAQSVRLGRDGLVLEAGPAAADVTEKRAWHRIALTGATVEAHGIRVGPLLIRASDGWSPDGPTLELVLPRDEARFSGERVSGRISGQARIHLPPGGAARASAELDLREVVVRHPALSRRPVGPSSMRIAGEATIEAAAVSVERLVASIGALEISARGRWSPDRTEVSLELARTRCARALASLPEGLAPVLVGMPLAGELAARGLFRLDRDRPDQAVLDLSFPSVCQALGDGPAARMSSVGTGVPSLRSYGKHVPAAFQVAEDLRFWDHDGFDVEQIRRALIHDTVQGSFSRGASTISQQVVKNLFLTHERTLSRKLQEAVLTWRMEQVVGKRRILEAYLDLVELGPGLRGVEAASQAYFGRAARALTPLEAVHLAALTPAPVRLARALAGGVTPAWRTRLDELLDFMRHQRLLSPSDWLRARGQRLVISPWPRNDAVADTGLD